MLGLYTIFKVLKQERAYNFLIYEIILVIFFALAYYFSDLFIFHYPEFSERMGLGSIIKADSLYSYIYFSLITQSGVGFGGILPDGGNVVTTNSTLLKILSCTQLFTVIYMLALVI